MLLSVILTMIYSCCCNDFVYIFIGCQSIFYRLPCYITLLKLSYANASEAKHQLIDLLYNFTWSQLWSAELWKQFILLNYSHGNRKIEESKWPHQGSNPGYQAQQAGFLSIRPRRHVQQRNLNVKILKYIRTSEHNF